MRVRVIGICESPAVLTDLLPNIYRTCGLSVNRSPSTRHLANFVKGHLCMIVERLMQVSEGQMGPGREDQTRTHEVSCETFSYLYGRGP